MTPLSPIAPPSGVLSVEDGRPDETTFSPGAAVADAATAARPTPPADGGAGEVGVLPPRSTLAAGPAGHVGHGSVAPPTVTGYQIIGRLGEGGMGTVWRARQLSTRREVALKLLNGIGSERARRRFDREVELTSRLQHPNIACLYDSGILQGVYYYAMELIDGVPLDEYVRRNGLVRAEGLRLMRKVCLAVQHAHQRGVIHRDLKPSNILISADGEPHVLDFGLAKFYLADDPGSGPPDAPGADAGPGGGTISLEGDLAGTAAFMSPEQASGRTDVLDTRTDVYSLGVVLYRLLTGRSPHDLSGHLLAVLRRIVEEDIIAPPKVPRGSKEGVDGDLRALLRKALAKDPEARYRSAGAMADDLGNYLRGEPLAARATSTVYFLRKKVWKHRLPLSLASGAAAVLVTLSVYASVQVARARDRAQALAQSEQRLRSEVELERAEDLLAFGAESAAAGRWPEAQAKQLKGRDLLSALRGPTFAADLALAETSPCVLAPLGEWAWQDSADLLKALAGAPGAPGAPGGGAGASVPLSLDGVAFSADRRFTLLRIAMPDRTRLEVWDSMKVQPVAALDYPRGIKGSLGLSPDGTRAVFVEAGGDLESPQARLLVWDIGPGDRVGEGGAAASAGSPAPALRHIGPGDEGVSCATFDNRGRIVSGSAGGVVRIWDADGTGVEHLLSGGPPNPASVTVAPDGGRVAAGGTDGSVTFWNLAAGTRRGPCPGHKAGTRSLAFSPDGRWLVSCGNDGSALIWDEASPAPFCSASPHAGPLWGVSIAPGPPQGPPIAVSVGADHLVQRWPLPRTEPGTLEPHTARVNCLAVSPDPRLVFVGGHLDADIQVVDLETGFLLKRIPGGQGAVVAVALGPDGRTFFSGHDNGYLQSWDLATGERLGGLKFDGRFHCAVAFSPDCRLALCDEGTALTLCETGGRSGRGRVIRVLLRRQSVDALGFSPDGKVAFGSTAGGSVHFWDAATGDERLQLSWGATPAPYRVTRISVSADGAWALCGVSSGQVKLFDVRPDARRPDSGAPREVRLFAGHDGAVTGLAFVADDRMALSAGEDATLRVWDLENGRQVYGLSTGAGPIDSVALSSDQQVILAVARGGQAVRRWELSRPLRSRDLRGRAGAAHRGLAEHPEDPALNQVLGEWLALNGDWGAAAGYLEKGLAAGGPQSLLTLARCRWRLGQAPAAARRFSEAADEAPAESPLRTYARMCQQAAAPERP